MRRIITPVPQFIAEYVYYNVLTFLRNSCNLSFYSIHYVTSLQQYEQNRTTADTLLQ